MVKYDEATCFWCGKHIGEGNKAYSSLATDTLHTMRNFCTKEHLLKFKDKAKKSKAGFLTLRPYYGKKD